MHKALITLLPSIVTPVLLALVLQISLNDRKWIHEPLHSLVEGVGSLAALILAAFIIMMRNNNQLRPNYVWVASGLVGMGLLDGFHASVNPGNTFVWLHSIAIFVGGLFIALVIAPERVSTSFFSRFAPYVITCIAIVLGLASIVNSNWIPLMTEDDGFTLNAAILNICGGIGFLAAGFYYLAKGRGANGFKHEHILLANHCLLFGTAGLLFEFSTLWDATWWLWHVLRLVAYLILLWFFIGLYYKNVRKVQESEAKFRTLVKNIPGIVYRCLPNANWTMLFMSPAVEDITGYKVGDFINDKVRSYASIIHPDDVDIVKRNVFTAIKERQPFALDYRIISRDGNIHYILERGVAMLDKSNIPAFLDGTIFDVTNRREYEQQVQLLKTAFDTSSDAMFILDSKFRIINVNRTYEKITGYSKQEALNTIPITCQPQEENLDLNMHILKSLHQHGLWRGQVWGRRKNGTEFPSRLTINKIYDDREKKAHYVGIFQDITEEKRSEQILENLAYFDQLTQIPNRASFNRRLEQNIADAKRHGTKLAIILIDLDKFKYINDTLGHVAGDRLLQVVAQRLKDNIRQNDTVARLGGDEFIVIATDLSHAEQATPVVKSIIDDLEKPLSIYGHEVQTRGSIGIALYPDDGANVSQLIKCADLAMYEAKDTSGERYCFYSQKIQNRVTHFIRAEAELRKGIEKQEFILYYQPKFNLMNGTLAGAEALARWKKPQDGIVLPDKFISLAEESALIEPLGQLLFSEACRQMSDWKPYSENIKLAINLSAKQFMSKKLIQFINTILDENCLSAKNLEIEITESTIMKDVEECTSKMSMLKALGISLAVDDFGTGYSSLSYLKRFPIDTLKIDKSFVSDLSTNSSDADIIKAIINLAQSMHLDVVAEGVETKLQLQFLKEHGCQMAQGYLLGRPVPGNEFEEQFIFHKPGLFDELPTVKH